MSNTKRTGTHRLNGPISVLNPMPDKVVLADGKIEYKKILKPGHYVFDGRKWVPYHEYFSRPENNSPAVHTDQGWIDKFDWGAGKNWAEHGGRRGREDWLKESGNVCKG